MAQTVHPVWLQSVAAPAEGCGGCTAEVPACQALQAARCEQPALEGDPVRLGSVLQALRQVADADGNLVDSRRFSALRVAADEVELTLSFPRRCGPSQWLADDSFQVLRRVLPDTDVYVRHAS